MHMETCVVVSSHRLLEKLRKRQDSLFHSHRTNHDFLACAEKHKDCLAYNTSLFTGTSGSPVFYLNGNTVAIHSHGYILDVQGRHYSLMKFGVKFSAICEDMRAWDVLFLNKLFPNHDLYNHAGTACVFFISCPIKIAK